MARSSMTTAISPPAAPSSALERRLAAVGEDRLVAEFRDGGLEQAALHRIVIDYEDGTCHEDRYLEACLGAVAGNWINLAQGSKQGFKKAGERSL